MILALIEVLASFGAMVIDYFFRLRGIIWAFFEEIHLLLLCLLALMLQVLALLLQFVPLDGLEFDCVLIVLERNVGISIFSRIISVKIDAHSSRALTVSLYKPVSFSRPNGFLSYYQ